MQHGFGFNHRRHHGGVQVTTVAAHDPLDFFDD
ncbi:Uncharacterised protein [Vibrio cholerae]|nr:Uncharacterised protein [Vibrio cholerae]